MTDYTKDEHALPYPEGGNQVAVHGDIQALAVRTGVAITLSESSARVASNNYTDGVAKSTRRDLTEYTDAQTQAAMTSALEAAESYTDEVAEDTRRDLTEYTDSKTQGIRDHFSTSHIALDTDGVPFFSPGSMSVQIHQDADGVPYFETA